MSLMSSLKEALDKRGCTGFTIWPLRDGWLQVNLRRQDNVSWDCKDCKDLDEAIEHIESFNAFEERRGTDRRRVPVDREAARKKALAVARRRKDDDLI